jgi:predicted 2-oxoglutarate/Fe(II)-dependent dioxygenase YbiX
MQKILFTKDDCRYILSGIDDSPGTSDLDTNDRKYKEWLIVDRNILDFILNKVSHLGVIHIKEGRILRYESGSFFEQHLDTWYKYPHRLKTLLIQLSEETDYVGGDMTFGGELFQKNIGNIVMFDGKVWHGMDMVTYGIRYVFVIWLDRDDMGIVKSVL